MSASRIGSRLGPPNARHMTNTAPSDQHRIDHQQNPRDLPVRIQKGERQGRQVLRGTAVVEARFALDVGQIRARP